MSIVATRWIDGVEMPNNLFAPEFSLAFLVFFLIYNGLGEEVGWRGYALPRLQKKFGSLAGSVILGFFWALWHIPLFIVPGSSQYGSSLPGYIWLLVCWSVIMTVLVYKAGGSVWVAIIFHETINFAAFTVNYPGYYDNLFWSIAAASALFFLPKPLWVNPWKGHLPRNIE